MRKPFLGEFRITQKFGENPDVYKRFGLNGHDGQDWGMPNGTPLYTPISGIVKEARIDPAGYGHYLRIENSELGVVLAHLKSFNVGESKEVTEGELVGWSNNTGFSTGPHLHFGIYTKPRQYQNGYRGYVDPEPFLNEDMATIKELEKKIEVLEHRQKELETDIERKNTLIKEREDELRKTAKEIHDWREAAEKFNQELAQWKEYTETYKKDIASLSEHSTAVGVKLNEIEQENQVLRDQNSAGIKEANKLRKEVEKLKKKMTKSKVEYASWKKIAWRFGRAFITGVLGSLVALEVLPESWADWKVAIGIILGAGLQATFKALREGKEFEAAIHKLPL